MGMATVGSRPQTAALLVDLENVLHIRPDPDDVTGSLWATPAEADGLISWILSETRRHFHAGNVAVVAACQARALDRYLGRAEFPHWLTLRFVPPGQDEADRFLLAEGMHFAGRGCQRLYLASGDNFFIPLASTPAFAGRTTLLVPYRGMLSRVLARLSGDVRYYQPPAVAGLEIAS